VVVRRCCAAPILGQSGSSAPPCWTLDVLNIVRRLVSVSATLRRDESEGRAPRGPNISEKLGRRRTPPSDIFTTAEAYAFTHELEKLHPDNPVNNTVTRGRNQAATSSPSVSAPLRRDKSRRWPAIARRARCLASAVNFFSTQRRQDAKIQNFFLAPSHLCAFALNPYQLKGRKTRIGDRHHWA
jgi:hypothetical protein